MTSQFLNTIDDVTNELWKSFLLFSQTMFRDSQLKYNLWRGIKLSLLNHKYERLRTVSEYIWLFDENSNIEDTKRAEGEVNYDSKRCILQRNAVNSVTFAAKGR